MSHKVACQVRDYQSGPEVFNETFLLQRNVPDMNDEKCSVSPPYLVGLVRKYKLNVLLEEIQGLLRRYEQLKTSP